MSDSRAAILNTYTLLFLYSTTSKHVHTLQKLSPLCYTEEALNILLALETWVLLFDHFIPTFCELHQFLRLKRGIGNKQVKTNKPAMGTGVHVNTDIDR